MVQINKCRALGMVLLTLFTTKSATADRDLPGWVVILGVTTYYPTKLSSNATEKATGKNQHTQRMDFIKANWSNLTADMARGEGQYLTALANLLEIPVEKRTAFYAMTKNKFNQLIPDSDTTAEQLVLKLKSESAKL